MERKYKINNLQCLFNENDDDKKLEGKENVRVNGNKNERANDKMKTNTHTSLQCKALAKDISYR